MKIQFSCTIPTGAQYENIKTSYEIDSDMQEVSIIKAKEILAKQISEDLVKWSNFKNRNGGK